MPFDLIRARAAGEFGIILERSRSPSLASERTNPDRACMQRLVPGYRGNDRSVSRNLRLLLSPLSWVGLYYLFLVMTAQNIHSALQMPTLTYSL